MFKKVLSTLLAMDFALGTLTVGIETAEKRTQERMNEICEQLEQYDSPTVFSSNKAYRKQNLGTFSFTFYVPDDEWGYQTATGVKSQHLKTCAVDPKVIPLGSVIEVVGNNGQRLVLKCVDVGGGIRGSKIDIFYDGTASEGYQWMAKFGTVHSVYLLEE